MDKAVLAVGGRERRVLTAFHSVFKLILSPAVSLEHVLGSCLLMLFWLFESLPRVGKPKQSLRLLGVQSTRYFPTIDVSNEENERFTVVIGSM